VICQRNTIKIVVTMSSSCYFQFKSQKEPTRVTFDGTGISVFELKREIINISKLGDGTDFDLSIYNKDTNEGNYRQSCKRLEWLWLYIADKAL